MLNKNSISKIKLLHTQLASINSCLPYSRAQKASQSLSFILSEVVSELRSLSFAYNKKNKRSIVCIRIKYCKQNARKLYLFARCSFVYVHNIFTFFCRQEIYAICNLPLDPNI